jgi:hypothetical protein
MSLFLDSSVALTWCFEDGHTPATLALLDQIAETGAMALTLWPLEILSGLAMGRTSGVGLTLHAVTRWPLSARPAGRSRP